MDTIANINMIDAWLVIARDKPVEVWWNKDDAQNRCDQIETMTGEKAHSISISVQEPSAYIAELIGENDVDKFENLICCDPIGQIITGSIGLEPLSMIRMAERFANNEIPIVYIENSEVQEKKLSELP
jgi:hypothetical protein